MNFVADEGVDFLVVHRRRSDGHEVVYVAEMDPGIDDERVLTIANERNALLLTANKDFGELVYRLGCISAGVLLMRLAGLPPASKAELISSVVRHHGGQLMYTFTVVTPEYGKGPTESDLTAQHTCNQPANEPGRQPRGRFMGFCANSWPWLLAAQLAVGLLRPAKQTTLRKIIVEHLLEGAHIFPAKAKGTFDAWA